MASIIDRGHAILDGMGSTPLAFAHHGPSGDVPLVLLHGFPLDSRMWHEVVGQLSDIPVITIDGPGFGSSPDGSTVAAGLGWGEPSLDMYADALAQSLLAGGISRAVVAGLSMGGYVALALADRHRDLLAGIGLLDTKAAADPAPARQQRLAAAAQAEQHGAQAVAGMRNTLISPSTASQQPDVVAQLDHWLAQAPAAGIAWAQRAMAARPDRHAVLAQLTIPGLVLRGAEDDLSPPQENSDMARSLGSGARRVTVPAAGHMTAIEQPGAVASALADLHQRAQVT